MKFVDIHSHILNDLDDGSRSQEETLKMLQMAVEENIEYMIATPHLREGYSHYDNDKYEVTFKSVEAVINENKLPLLLYQGQELFYDYMNIYDLKSGTAYPLANSKYLLFELPAFWTWESLREYLYELELMDYRLILAHVERYEQLQNKPDLLMKLSEHNVLFQVNSHSVNSKRKKVKRWVDKLLDNGYVDFIATDCHSTGRRRPQMIESYRYISKRLSQEKADYMFRLNGLKIINNEDIINEEPKLIKKRLFF